MILSLLAQVALAGEIEVHAATPVLVKVDGAVLEYLEGTLIVRATELKAGRHSVELYSMGGHSLASSSVVVPIEERVTLSWADGRLLEQSRMSLNVPEPEPSPAPGNTGVVPASPASLLVAGLASGAVVSLDGHPMAWSEEDAGYLGLSLSAGAHQLRVVEGQRLRFEGTVDLRAGAHLRCAPASPTPLACAWDGMAQRQPVATPAPLPPPPPAPAPAPLPQDTWTPVAMDPTSFGQLLDTVDNTAFSDDQVGLIRSAARSNWFTVDQVAAILNELPFSDDKLEVVRIVEPHLVDRENAWKLEACFAFSDDKDEVRAIFARKSG